MPRAVYITGNKNKADLMSQIMGEEIEHRKIDLDEIQSVDLRKIVEHKAKQAYAIIGTPVIVDDVSLGITELGGLPGPLIKWFVEHAGLEKICRMADSLGSRSAKVEIVYAYCSGREVEIFSATVDGAIVTSPRGNGGFGWDPIFISGGDDITWAEHPEPTYPAYLLRETALQKLKKYLEQEQQ